MAHHRKRVRRAVGRAFVWPAGGRFGGVLEYAAPRTLAHRLSPSDINARANIDALKRAGCTDIPSICAVQGPCARPWLRLWDLRGRRSVYRPHLRPRGELLRRGAGRPCVDGRAGLSAPLAAGRRGRGSRPAAPVVEGGTYLAMEGPQFSSRAESRLYRSWGCDVIGNMAGMSPSWPSWPGKPSCPMRAWPWSPDYDAWREAGAPVEVGEVLAVMRANAGLARETVRRFVAALPLIREASPIDTCLDQAIVTPPSERDPRMVARLAAVARPRAWRSGDEPCRRHPDHSRLPEARDHVPRHHHPSGRCARLSPRHRRDPHPLRRGQSRQGRRHRGPRFHPRRRGRPPGSPPASCRSASGASCRTRPSRWNTRSNTAPTSSRCTWTPSSLASGCCWSTI